MAAVLDAFLGAPSHAQFTEKLAGQHMTLTVLPSGVVEYTGKGGKVSRGGGLFPAVTQALQDHHPEVSKPQTYQFEVLPKVGRSDFIDYPLTKDFTVVELTGALDQTTADQLNRGQDDVLFLTEDAIKKAPASYVRDPAVKSALQDFRDRLLRGGDPDLVEVEAVEDMLMGLVDSGEVPSALGSAAIEGLFGKLGDDTFKIPGKKYSSVQKDQARWVAIARREPLKVIDNRFQRAVSDPSSDPLVRDLIEYVEKMSRIKLPRGFKTFFSQSEMVALNSLAVAYADGDSTAGSQLVKQFFKRVNTKSAWVSSGLSESLLRTLIRDHIRTLI